MDASDFHHRGQRAQRELWWCREALISIEMRAFVFYCTAMVWLCLFQPRRVMEGCAPSFAG